MLSSNSLQSSRPARFQIARAAWSGASMLSQSRTTNDTCSRSNRRNRILPLGSLRPSGFSSASLGIAIAYPRSIHLYLSIFGPAGFSHKPVSEGLQFGVYKHGRVRNINPSGSPAREQGDGPISTRVHKVALRVSNGTVLDI